jgi:hypothetical protein
LGVDTIGDFQSGQDTIVLDLRTFTALTSYKGSGFSVSTEFTTVTTDEEAETSSAIIVYNRVNGKLFYNLNGVDFGFGRGGQFALLPPRPFTMTPPELANNDFLLR